MRIPSSIDSFASRIQDFYCVTIKRIPGSKWLCECNPAVVWTIVTALCVMIFCGGVTGVLFYNKTQGISGPLPSYEWYILLTIVLISTPLSVYNLVLYSANPSTGPATQLEQQWDETLELCDKLSIDVSTLPLILVLGTHTPEFAKKLMDLSVCSLKSRRHSPNQNRHRTRPYLATKKSSSSLYTARAVCLVCRRGYTQSAKSRPRLPLVESSKGWIRLSWIATTTASQLKGQSICQISKPRSARSVCSISVG